MVFDDILLSAITIAKVTFVLRSLSVALNVLLFGLSEERAVQGPS